MQCSLCGQEFARAHSGESICPECRNRLDDAASSGSGLATMFRQPTTLLPARPPHPSARGREVWQADREAAGIAWPISVARSPSGEVLLLDQPENYRVLRFNAEGQYLGMLMEIPLGDGPEELSDPRGLCVDRHGRLFFPDGGADRISIWSAEGISTRSVM